MRPLALNATGAHRDSAALSAGVVKVGVLGALATATIAVPLASATADQHTGAAAALPAPLQNAQNARAAVQAAAQPVSIPATSGNATTTGVGTGAAAQDMAISASQEVQAAAANTTSADAVPSAEGYIQPVQAPVTSDFGWRVHPTLGYRKLHDGMDFGATCGTPVKAAAAGTVVKVESTSASGNRVDVDHGNGVITGYFHLSRTDVKTGDTLQQGQVLGTVGSTGRSTGCHLHFAEMDAAGNYMDPQSLFR